MTANYIARVVQSLFEKIDLDEITSQWKDIEIIDGAGRFTDEWINRKIESKEFTRWLMACSKLEDFCRKNILTFEQTELVYRWAKNYCEMQNRILNEYRAKSFGVYTLEEWYKKNKI